MSKIDKIFQNLLKQNSLEFKFVQFPSCTESRFVKRCKKKRLGVSSVHCN